MSRETYNPILSAVARELRSTRPITALDTYTRLESVPGGTLADIWFRSRGCSYDRCGSCTMCNYEWSTPPAQEEQVAFVEEALRNVPTCLSELLISPSGSMLDVVEVPHDVRRRIFELAAGTDCGLFLFETRPETVSDVALEEYVRMFAGTRTRLAVEMGLESSNPWVLRYCVNKQMAPDDFVRALEMLKQHGLLAYANVSLGTAFLTECEAIRDAVATVRWALSLGVDKVVLFPLHVKAYTVLHQLWANGLHRPTSLWSLAEVLRQLGDEPASRVEIAWYTPPAQAERPPYPIPTTCERCEAEVVRMLDAYKKTMNFSYIVRIDAVRCSCHDEWRRRIEASVAISLEDRVAAAYELLSQQVLGTRWWGEDGMSKCLRHSSPQCEDGGDG